jgi:hypothetical protein
MRNPLIARLKDGSGFAHCSEDVPKGKNRPFLDDVAMASLSARKL